MDYLRKHIHAVIGVILYLITVLLILLLLGFSTPLPLPEEEGILIDFGGSGTTESARPARTQTEESTRQESDRAESSGVVTQDYEETVSMPSDDTPSEADISDRPSTGDDAPEDTQEETSQDDARNLDDLFRSALESGQNGGGSSGQTGTGHPGMGDGSSEGQGTGPGGIGGSIEGRQLVHRVEPERKPNLVGTVEFRITVNEHGVVTNIRLVRSNCAECNDLARKALQQWRYAPKPGSGYQSGNVTIHFEPL